MDNQHEKVCNGLELPLHYHVLLVCCVQACLSQDDPADDEEEREGHPDSQANVNAKENSRSEGHQPHHLFSCVCAFIARTCVCMWKCKCQGQGSNSHGNLSYRASIHAVSALTTHRTNYGPRNGQE